MKLQHSQVKVSAGITDIQSREQIHIQQLLTILRTMKLDRAAHQVFSDQTKF
ncbi:MAG: hypothetical protein ACREA8_06170 [Nitrosotalea sp.]